MSNKPAAKYLNDYKVPSHHVDSLYLEFHLEPHDTKVIATSKWHAQRPTQELVLDGSNMELVELSIDGVAWTHYELNAKHLILRNLPDEFELAIKTKINPAGNTSLEGLYKSGSAYCTQCEAEGFRKITYFLDRPDVLTTYTVKIVADKSVEHLLSNGNLIERGEVDTNKHYAIWQDPFRKPSYLFALVAGKFDVLNDRFMTQSGREVTLKLFVDKGNLNKADHAMVSLKKSMEWDEKRFGLEYDLDIYMIVAVDFFNMGAMENKGLNVFNSACVLANQSTATDRDYHTIESIVGHEYFHNWTGNRVTCRDWFQLSLKEGLTVFRDQEFSSDLGSRGLNRIDAVNALRTHQFTEDAGPMAHPIRPEKVIEMNNFYTVTVYNKGAEVIRMLHTVLGEDGFQKGMKRYIAKHDGQAATCDDFVDAMADANQVDLSQFSQWYSQFGTPRLRVESQFDQASCTLLLTLHQSPPKNNLKQSPLHIPVAIQLLDENGDNVELESEDDIIGNVLHLKKAKQTFTLKNIKARPVIVALEDFSAPVFVDFEQSISDRLHILRYARSDFSRWEAMQQVFTDSIKQGIKDPHYQLDEKLIESCKTLLKFRSGDLALLSELLTLPSFESLASQFENVPVDELLGVMNRFELQLANELKTHWAAAYQALDDDHRLTSAGVGVRAFRNTCLYYFAKTDLGVTSQLLEAQLQSANMTVCLGALRALVMADHAMCEQALNEFDAKWRHDPLVMDKWFAMQAVRKDSDAVVRINTLFNHPCFDMSNPNRVRALIGTFARANPTVFHHSDGKGYELLGDVLINLNAINPQNASRMITPLMSYARYDPTRADLIKGQLERLAMLENLSDDLFEKVDKALHQDKA
ncbi:Membrane alanine aminopeptidase N [Pseudoalteromonas luteoviolacea B = ATCC 29581]|nr:Membrane alanine aminopeptidase N [Pseudoalteromonas luteoviolacea B = ATCC 29581]